MEACQGIIPTWEEGEENCLWAVSKGFLGFHSDKVEFLPYLYTAQTPPHSPKLCAV